MLTVSERLASPQPADDQLHLNYAQRSKVRLRCHSAVGVELGLFLPRGQTALADGDCLRASDGRVFQIVAAPEQLLEVTCANPFELMRAAYHLGNRHVPLQLSEHWLRLAEDSVLAHMLEQLGAQLRSLQAPFHPEAGAYGGGHHHSHGDDSAQFHYAPKLHQFGVRR